MASKGRPGRKSSQQFIALQLHILRSPEYLRLSAKAVKLLIDIWAQFNGFNNGDLCATWSVMKKKGWRSRGTLAAASNELEFAGWLERTRQGGRNKCNLYALSMYKIDDCKGKLDCKATTKPSNLWRDEIRLPTRIAC